MPDPIQLITSELLDATVARACQSPRRRVTHNFHTGDDATLHRFLNAIARGTYVTPHRHVSPPKPESFLVLSGTVGLFIFDDQGAISKFYRIGERGLLGIDIAPGIWHSIVALSDSAVIFEVKPGPYAPVADKDFARFAPREGDSGAGSYLAGLLAWAEAQGG